MKLVIQRVKKAKVIKKETKEIVGEIGAGLFVLLGIKKGDTEKNADQLVEKLLKIRLMSDKKDKMNLSVVDTKSEILVVSQFTLYANTKDGNRPSFIEAEDPENAKKLYLYFVEQLRNKNLKIETGSFGDYMEINCFLDGPLTIVVEK
ncbi:MAG: D-tyrosyl-tRNA(Tyr) deacylase [Parcubacteria group bacterium GW2011_GWA1_38_7]|nr:MAG: D-tyrosyl-tRNA(Tyr) deacylase [Parcubacteria group bacterium GW2011_GWA1_38_7]